jgi:hypothetical protein
MAPTPALGSAGLRSTIVGDNVKDAGTQTWPRPSAPRHQRNQIAADQSTNASASTHLGHAAAADASLDDICVPGCRHPRTHAHTCMVLPWRQEGCSVMELPCGPRQNGWGGDCVCWRATRAGQPQSPRGCFRLRQSSFRRFPAGGGLGLAHQHCSCRDESPPRVARDIRKQRDRVSFSDAPLLCKNVPPSSRLSATGGLAECRSASLPAAP